VVTTPRQVGTNTSVMTCPARTWRRRRWR
jgi:hypothetical protein